MPRGSDGERQRIANMKRRAAMLERHARNLDPTTGKSRLAVEAGRKGGRATVERQVSPKAWALRMNLKRWHGVELKQKSPDSNADSNRCG
jgi:hypothetical protein